MACKTIQEQPPVRVPDYSVIEPFSNDLKRFIHAMEYKLRLNAHKGRWEDLDIDEALKKLSSEVEELRGAIKLGNTMEIILEAADIANFAMIVASIAVERVKK